MVEKVRDEQNTRTTWSRIKDHLRINRHLLPLKVVILLFYGGAVSFLPYITLHMIQSGITIEEVGIIYAVLPFASCFGPPIAGMVADKIGNYKLVLMVAVAATGCFHTLLLTIDANGIDPSLLRINDNKSHDIILHCKETGPFELEWASGCDNNTYCPYEELRNVTSIALNVSSDCISTCQNLNDTTAAHFVDQLCILDGNKDITTGGCGLVKPDENGVVNITVSSLLHYTEEELSSCSFPFHHLSTSNTTQARSPACVCSMRCPVTHVEPKILNPCHQPAEYDHDKHQRGFWAYLFVRILATASLGTSWTMLDATTICLIRKYKGELGKQRLLGVVGSAIFGLCSGLILDWAATLNNGVKDYGVVFYLADCLYFLVIVILFIMEVAADKTEKHFLKNCLKLVQMFHINLFMLLMLLLGAYWGFLEAFLFIFLIELKASSRLLGFTVMLGALVGIPFLFVSDIIIKKTGRLVILISAFFVYSARFIGYSFIQDPWMSLPFEALEAVTIHLMGVSCSMYCAAMAPKGLLATLNGMSGAAHYSIGRGTGSFIGGILIATYGTRTTFQILGTSASIFGIIFVFLYFFILRKYDKNEKTSSKTLPETSTAVAADSPPDGAFQQLLQKDPLIVAAEESTNVNKRDFDASID